MKRVAAVIFMVFLLVPVLSDARGENPWEQKLPFESATIKYILSGVEKGTETLYIQKYGKETARYHKTTTTMMGLEMANETIMITDQDWIYAFDIKEKTGTKLANPQKFLIEEYNKLSSEEQKQVLQNSEEFGTSLSGDLGGKVVKNAENILGFICDKVTVMGATVYNIHDTGIALITESNILGILIKIEATQIDKGAVSNEFFQHPAGIVPEMDSDSDDMARSLAKQMMDTLKDPEATKKAMENQPSVQGPDQQNMTPEEQQQMEKAMEALKGIFGS